MTPLPPALRAALDRFKADQAGDMTDDGAVILALRELLVTLGYLDVVDFDEETETEGNA